MNVNWFPIIIMFNTEVQEKFIYWEVFRKIIPTDEDSWQIGINELIFFDILYRTLQYKDIFWMLSPQQHSKIKICVSFIWARTIFVTDEVKEFEINCCVAFLEHLWWLLSFNWIISLKIFCQYNWRCNLSRPQKKDYFLQCHWSWWPSSQ